jgi:CshA-type fibril repeat protein
VTFTSGGVVLCTVTLGASGAATSCPTSTTLPTGDYAVVASYSGDADFAAATARTGFTVGPVAEELTTTGPVRQPQQATVSGQSRDTITLIDVNGRPVTKVVEPGEGTYTLNPATGVITFTPLSTFAGTADAVRYRITDPAGQSATGTYRAVVVAPKPPHPLDRTSTGPIDSAQHTVVTVPHGDTITLVDANGRTVTHLQVPGKGSYSLDKATGVITFVPVAGFTGLVAAVTFHVVDPFGQVGAATYGPSVYGSHVPPVPVHGSPPPFQPPGLPVNLPFTGFNAERLLLVTAFMVATGTILVAASRRSVTGRLFGHRG